MEKTTKHQKQLKLYFFKMRYEFVNKYWMDDNNYNAV